VTESVTRLSQPAPNLSPNPTTNAVRGFKIPAGSISSDDARLTLLGDSKRWFKVSERAFWKTSILAMKCAKWKQTQHCENTPKLTPTSLVSLVLPLKMRLASLRSAQKRDFLKNLPILSLKAGWDSLSISPSNQTSSSKISGTGNAVTISVIGGCPETPNGGESHPVSSRFEEDEHTRDESREMATLLN